MANKKLPSLNNLLAKDIVGNLIDFSLFKEKVVLIVNIATQDREAPANFKALQVRHLLDLHFQF